MSTEIKISNEFPPNIEAMRRAFPLCEEHKAIFAYGDTIYNPYGAELNAHTIAHEAKHFEQQRRESSVEDWYTKYIFDKAFRLKQEVEAYRTQYAFVAKHVHDREMLSWLRGKLAESLSSALYGSLCTPSEARVLLAP